MKIEKLFLALCAKNLVVDLVTQEGRTYQISGDKRFQGMYERLPSIEPHSEKRTVENAEMQSALDQTTEIRLWIKLDGDHRVITETNLKEMLAPFPVE